MHSRLKAIRDVFCSMGLLLITVAGFSQITDSVTAPVPDTSEVYDEVVESPGATTSSSFEPLEHFEQERSAVRAVPDSFVNRLRKDPNFAYVKNGLKHSEPPAAGEKQQNSSSSSSAWPGIFAALPYIAITIFIVLLVWYLAANNFILFRKKSTSLPTPETQEDPRDIFAIDYATSIRQALQQKNYRLAIRLQYLELLKKLSDNGLIHFLPDKTNFEYLAQLRSSSYYDDFFTATRNYEYSWYGLFDISENMYQKINNTFQQLKQKL